MDKKKYKIRFHLGRGKNYKHWRIENMISKDVKFYNPEIYKLKIFGSTLKNRKSTAKKIFGGAHKSTNNKKPSKDYFNR